MRLALAEEELFLCLEMFSDRSVVCELLLCLEEGLASNVSGPDAERLPKHLMPQMLTEQTVHELHYVHAQSREIGLEHEIDEMDFR